MLVARSGGRELAVVSPPDSDVVASIKMILMLPWFMLREQTRQREKSVLSTVSTALGVLRDVAGAVIPYHSLAYP